MSQGSSTAAANVSSAQKSAPFPLTRLQRLPERPRDGKSKRTIIESACAACQKRKSRCDGQRPICSRCRALHTDCGYNVEEGESRWSALSRKIRTLERERDEAHELLSQIQSRPEPEAQRIYRHIRSHAPTSDMNALIEDVTSAIPTNPLQLERQPPHQQQQGRTFYDQQYQQLEHQPQPQQCQHSQQIPHQQQQRPHEQHQQQPQQQNATSFFQSSYPVTDPTNQLPPLRSIVKVPVSGIDAAHLQQQPQTLHFPPMAQRRGRKMSQASGMLSASHSSRSSSGTRDQHTLSPRDSPSNWAQGSNQ